MTQARRANSAIRPERVVPCALAVLSSLANIRLGKVMLTRSMALDKIAGSIPTIAQTQPLNSRFFLKVDDIAGIWNRFVAIQGGFNPKLDRLFGKLDGLINAVQIGRAHV